MALGYNAGTSTYTNSMALGANSSVGANNVISLGDGSQKVGIGTTVPLGKFHLFDTGENRLIIDRDPESPSHIWHLGTCSHEQPRAEDAVSPHANC